MIDTRSEMRHSSKSSDEEDPEAQRRSGYRAITDTEAGGPQLVPRDDSDEDEDDDDEGLYHDVSKESMDKGQQDLPFWDAELSQLSNSVINEAMLHQVPWDQVGKQFALNLAAAVVPLAVHCVIGHAVLGGSTLLQLPFFIIAALLLVISAELVADNGPLAKALFGSVAMAMPLIASIVCHLDFQDPVAWAITLTKFIGCSWMACSLLVVLYNAYRKTLYNSGCYNALTGRKVVKLRRKMDIVKLVKAMTVVPKRALEKQAGWFAWMLNTDCSCRKRGKVSYDNNRMQRIVLGRVSVDDKDPMVPPVALELDGQELDDGQYRLVRLAKQGSAEDPELLKDLQTILRRKGKVTDQFLRAWLDPQAEPHGWKTLTEEAQKVKRWFVKNDFNEEPFVLYATASNIDRVQGLFEHWAPRALVMSAVTAVFSLPARYFYANMLSMQADVCEDVSSKGIRLPGGELLCSSQSECASLCSSQLSFVEAVNTILHTSHVESLFIFVLLPTFVFIFSVDWVKREHQALEKKYLKGMSRSRSAIREVTHFKIALEKMMKTGPVWSRFVSRFKARNSYDPALSAKRSLKSEASNHAVYENGVFEYVVNHITSSASAHTVDEIALECGIGVAPAEPPDAKEYEDQPPYSEKILHRRTSCIQLDRAILEEPLQQKQSSATEEPIQSEIEELWRSLKVRNNLGGVSQKNFAVAFTVSCRSASAWALWRKWLLDDPSETGYKRQLDYICRSEGAQDSGKGSHLNKSVVIGNQVVPKGFSLTHIRTENPQDDSQFVIEFGTPATAESLRKEIKVMEKMLCAPTDEDTLIGRTKVTLNERFSQEKDNEREIAVRFVLTEQYWSKMSPEERSGLLPPNITTTNFAQFVDHMLKPMAAESQKAETEDSDDFDDMTMSFLTVIMGEDDPMISLVATGKILLVRVWVAVLCAMFISIPPLFRVFLQGGKLFPHPFASELVFNMVFSALALWSFLSNFQKVTERLALMAAALASFEQRTIDPSGRVAKAAEKSEDKKKGRQEKAPEPSPFDLTVGGGQGIVYDPTDKYWVDQWKEKQDNVQNWHLCVGYIRVFVSTSRLTAQAILLAAGVILAFVLLLSLIQGLQGKGVATLHGDVLASNAVAHASAHLDHARRLSLSLAKDSIISGVGTGAGSPEDVSIALAALRQELHSRMGEMSILNRRLGEDAASMAGNFDASKVTKTQVLTMAMVLLLIFYSVPLLWNVAKINDCFDRHGNILLGQKEVHRMNMAIREASRLQMAKTNAGREAGGEATSQADKDSGHASATPHEDADPGSDPARATPDGEASPAANSVQHESTMQHKHSKVPHLMRRLIPAKNSKVAHLMRRRASEGDAASDPASAMPDEEASPAADAVQQESKTHDKNSKDPASRRYEKMLDMAIQAANKNKTRFPLKLFGFTINMALLTTWIVLAVSPLVKQAQQMVPGLAVAGCHYLERSQLVQQADDAAASLGKEAASIGLKGNLGKMANKFSMKKLVKEEICKPFIKWAKDKAEDAAEYVAGDKRRLSAAAPAIAPLIKTWWGKHPGNPHAKFFGVTQALHDLEHVPQSLAAPVEALPPADQKMEMLVASDLQSWLHHHDLPETVKSKLKSEAIDTVAKLGMLSDDDVILLCRGERLGDKAAVKLLVKAAQDASKPKRSSEL